MDSLAKILIELHDCDKEMEIVSAGLNLNSMKIERGERLTESDVQWITRYDILQKRLADIRTELERYINVEND